MSAAKSLFDYSATVADRAVIQRIATPAGAVTLAFPNAVREHQGVGGAVTDIMRAAALTSETLERVAPDSSESGLRKAATAAVDRDVRPKYRLLQEAAHAALANLDKRWTEMHTPQFPKGSEPAVRAATVSWFREWPAPQKLAATRADPGLAAAVVEAGLAASGLPPEAFAEIEREMAVGQLAAKLAAQHDYRTQPTADDPIGGQPDHAAARKAAEDRLKGMTDERELLALIAPLLSSVVNATALMTGESRQAAFERLTSR